MTVHMQANQQRQRLAEATGGDGFMRLRDERWWKARERFEQQSRTLVDDGELTGEPCRVRFSMASNGKIAVESKGDMKKRG
jgi:hypothetical protein